MIPLPTFPSKHPMMQPAPAGWAHDLVLYMRSEHVRARLGRAYLSILLALSLLIIMPAIAHVMGAR